jgi:8-oxo-dGTP pyrophosphatase MutT (NUDIX family)
LKLGGGKLELEEKIIGNVEKALKEERGVATGIGIFGAIFEKNKILLRRRVEKESLIYRQDLSGKWELVGGGVELSDFGEEYQSVIKNTLVREVKEEAGLEIDVEKVPIVLLPAVLKRSSIQKQGLIDWAFVVPIDYGVTRETEEYKRKLETGEICWFAVDEIDTVEIVSERMKYLIKLAIDYRSLHRQI